MKKVGFVILHYKDIEVTDMCVQSILQMDQQDKIKIVVVDNDIQEIIEKRQKLLAHYRWAENITVLQIQENGGFSYANNRGYERIREELRDCFIVVANNDIEFIQQDFVYRINEIFNKSHCHILAPDIIQRGSGNHQNPLDISLRTKEEAESTIRMNRLGLYGYPFLYPLIRWKLQNDEKEALCRKKQNEQFYKVPHPNIVPFGACLIFTPDYVKNETRAFDPETQFFYEEYILAYKCKQKNYLIYYEPSVKIYHESGQATKRTYSSDKKRIRFMLERTKEACEVYLRLIDTQR